MIFNKNWKSTWLLVPLSLIMVVPLVFLDFSCAPPQTPTADTSAASQPCTTGVVNFTGNPTPAPIGSTTSKTMTINVNFGTQGQIGNAYDNEPTVSVTICNPSNPSQCQTINNLLLDTGSYGLRIFAQAISIPLTPVTNGSSSLAECVQYGDGSSQWGPVNYAWVQMAGEPKVYVPILVVDSTYQSAPSLCTSAQSTPDTSPSADGYNGIIGVGLFAQDCGSNCVTDANNQQYYTCNGSTCYCGATVDSLAQVTNPIDALPTDWAGVTLDFNNLSAATAANPGYASGTGTLYLGQTSISNSKTYTADGYGNFTTTYPGYSSTAMDGFIDSGSSILFFPPPANGALPDCGGNFSGIFCPSSLTAVTATNTSSTTSVSGSVTVNIGNGQNLMESTDNVFSAIGGTSLSSGGSPYFDWGFPFFIGRSVTIGIGFSGTPGHNTGNPYWTY